MATLLGLISARASSALAADKDSSQAAWRISPFGIGPDNKNGQDLPGWIPQMAEIGIHDLRSCRNGWRGVEPAEGKWDFTHLDEQLDYLDKYQIRTACLLMGRGVNSKLKGQSLPLDDLPGWQRYAQQMAAHTKGRIDHFEVWNEAPNFTNNAPPEDYAKILIAAYDGVKAGNPDAKVALAVKSVHVNYIEKVIQAGGKDHFDYITLHPYEVLGCVTTKPGTEAVYMNIVKTVHTMLAAQNPSKKDCPVWFTEIGNGGKKGWDVQGQALVKAYTMGIAQGVECINWFEGKDGDSGPMGLMDANNTPRLSYKAMQQMIAYLGRYPDYVGWVLLNDKHYGFVFRGEKGPILITWTSTHSPDKVSFGRTVTLIDPLTGSSKATDECELTLSPVMAVGVPEALVAQAAENKKKPFPWGGDYTNVDSVSVTMGEKNVEKGLHTKSAEEIGADVILYGGGARAGTVPGGNAFIVDPNFLCYSHTPIEISFVVRRNEANEPANIVLEYESADGCKKLQPFEIPDNKQWHTASFKINDAEFVNTWAFSFRINAGKYVIQSVMVRKLQSAEATRPNEARRGS